MMDIDRHNDLASIGTFGDPVDGGPNDSTLNHDKKLSFTDASVIATVKAEGLDGVFGFDEDFRRCEVALDP